MQTLQQKLEAIRNSLDRADAAKGASQIGHILIAISQLTDIIEQATLARAPQPGTEGV